MIFRKPANVVQTYTKTFGTENYLSKMFSKNNAGLKKKQLFLQIENQLWAFSF